MTKRSYITCTAYAALFFSAVLTVLCLRHTWSGFSPALDALAVLALQVLGYALTRRRSMLAFAFSFVPALPLLGFFLTGGIAWLAVSAALLLILAGAYNIRCEALPRPRFSTQKWLGALILAEVMLVLIILLFLK